MHARHYAAGLVLLASCASTSPTPEETATIEASAKQRLDVCLEAMRKSETHDTVMACRLLWREPACQNAWESSLAASRGDRPKIILDGCLPSYCSDAAGICGWDRTQMDLESETPDWFEGWAELNRKVLPVDLEGQVEAPEAGEFAKRLLFLVTLQR